MEGCDKVAAVANRLLVVHYIVDDFAESSDAVIDITVARWFSGKEDKGVDTDIGHGRFNRR
jgi:hypothetical protein